MTCTLILTSLLMLSADKVAVHVEKREVPNLSPALCKQEEQAVRRMGPQMQAKCFCQEVPHVYDR